MDEMIRKHGCMQETNIIAAFVRILNGEKALHVSFVEIPRNSRVDLLENQVAMTTADYVFTYIY